MRKVVVKPKSSKAKNRLANTMEGNPVCVVEQDSGGELFLAAENRKYFFWVSTRTGTNRFGDKADAHWEVMDPNSHCWCSFYMEDGRIGHLNIFLKDGKLETRYEEWEVE